MDHPVGLLLLPLALLALWAPTASRTGEAAEGAIKIRLPPPRRDGALSVEEALRRRRSVRSYAEGPLTLAEVGQLLWAAQGVTGPDGKRTAPSAGALYPLEVFLVAGRVEELETGVYRYRPAGHELLRCAEGDRRRDLAGATRQGWIGTGPAILIVAAVYERTEVKYGARAERYVPIEAGAAGENVYLQATALGLGTVMVGAFDDRVVREVLTLRAEEEPLLLMPVGRGRGR